MERDTDCPAKKKSRLCEECCDAAIRLLGLRGTGVRIAPAGVPTGAQRQGFCLSAGAQRKKRQTSRSVFFALQRDYFAALR